LSENFKKLNELKRNMAKVKAPVQITLMVEGQKKTYVMQPALIEKHYRPRCIMLDGPCSGQSVKVTLDDATIVAARSGGVDLIRQNNKALTEASAGPEMAPEEILKLVKRGRSDVKMAQYDPRNFMFSYKEILALHADDDPGPYNIRGVYRIVWKDHSIADLYTDRISPTGVRIASAVPETFMTNRPPKIPSIFQPTIEEASEYILSLIEDLMYYLDKEKDFKGFSGYEPLHPEGRRGDGTPYHLLGEGTKKGKKNLKEEFMKPEITHDRWWELSTSDGTVFLPMELSDGTPEDLLQYTELSNVDDIYDVEEREGYGARMSAPGYMDATDWTVFDTEKAAEEYLDEYYGTVEGKEHPKKPEAVLREQDGGAPDIKVSHRGYDLAYSTDGDCIALQVTSKHGPEKYRIWDGDVKEAIENGYFNLQRPTEYIDYLIDNVENYASKLPNRGIQKAGEKLLLAIKKIDAEYYQAYRAAEKDGRTEDADRLSNGYYYIRDIYRNLDKEDFRQSDWELIAKAVEVLKDEKRFWEHMLTYGITKEDITLQSLMGESIEKNSKALNEEDEDAPDIEYEEIRDVLERHVEALGDTIKSEWEGYGSDFGEVEHQSRDGFMAFTDGGWEAEWLIGQDYPQSTGKSLPTSKLRGELSKMEDSNHKNAQEWFAEKYPDITKELGGQSEVDYHSLTNAGHEDKAEEFDEQEREYFSDETIMMGVRALYYGPWNSRGEEGKHTVAYQGYVNLESPYHRQGRNENGIEVIKTFNDLTELDSQAAEAMKEVQAWFDGEANVGTPIEEDHSSYTKTRSPLTAYHVFLDNDTDYVTDMAANVTLDMARKYFVGKDFEQPDGSMAKVLRVEPVKESAAAKSEGAYPFNESRKRSKRRVAEARDLKVSHRGYDLRYGGERDNVWLWVDTEHGPDEHNLWDADVEQEIAAGFFDPRKPTEYIDYLIDDVAVLPDLEMQESRKRSKRRVAEGGLNISGPVGAYTGLPRRSIEDTSNEMIEAGYDYILLIPGEGPYYTYSFRVAEDLYVKLGGTGNRDVLKTDPPNIQRISDYLALNDPADSKDVGFVALGYAKSRQQSETRKRSKKEELGLYDSVDAEDDGAVYWTGTKTGGQYPKSTDRHYVGFFRSKRKDVWRPNKEAARKELRRFFKIGVGTKWEKDLRVEPVKTKGVRFEHQSKKHSSNRAPGITEVYEGRSNLEFHGFSMDGNGNKVAQFSFPNRGSFSIQTNGNLPKTHRIDDEQATMADWPEQLLVIEDEAIAYIQAHMPTHARVLKVYEKRKQTNEAVDAHDPKLESPKNPNHSREIQYVTNGSGKLTSLASNMTNWKIGEYDFLFSYATPVAYFHPDEGTVITDKKWSPTTSSHIRKWQQHHNLSNDRSKFVPQTVIDDTAFDLPRDIAQSEALEEGCMCENAACEGCGCSGCPKLETKKKPDELNEDFSGPGDAATSITEQSLNEAEDAIKTLVYVLRNVQAQPMVSAGEKSKTEDAINALSDFIRDSLSSNMKHEARDLLDKVNVLLLQPQPDRSIKRAHQQVYDALKELHELLFPSSATVAKDTLTELFSEPTLVVELTKYYAPWEEGQDEPELIDHDRDEHPVEYGDEDETMAQQAARIILDGGGIHPSSSPGFHPGMWYSTETEIDPRTGRMIEKSFHMRGLNAPQEREVFDILKGELQLSENKLSESHAMFTGKYDKSEYKRGELPGADRRYRYRPFKALVPADQRSVDGEYPHKLAHIADTQYFYPVKNSGRMARGRRWIPRETAAKLYQRYEKEYGKRAARDAIGAKESVSHSTYPIVFVEGQRCAYVPGSGPMPLADGDSLTEAVPAMVLRTADDISDERERLNRAKNDADMRAIDDDIAHVVILDKASGHFLAMPEKEKNLFWYEEPELYHTAHEHHAGQFEDQHRAISEKFASKVQWRFFHSMRDHSRGKDRKRWDDKIKEFMKSSPSYEALPEKA